MIVFLDVDECLENNGGCDQLCTNKPGTHMCECNDGYTKTSERGGYCVDINECALNNGHGPCQDTCINLEGSYACSCEGKLYYPLSLSFRFLLFCQFVNY